MVVGYRGGRKVELERASSFAARRVFSIPVPRPVPRPKTQRLFYMCMPTWS